MRILVPLALLVTTLAGCLGAEVPEPADLALNGTTNATGNLTLPDPIVQEFKGRMTASPLGPLAHQDAQTEMMVASVQREGFLLDIVEVPAVIQLDLEWTSATPATMFAMVNVPTSTAGKVLDFFSERSNSGAVCMRIPVEEIQPGPLSIMAHSAGAVGLDWTMKVTTIGGDAKVVDRGHMEVERGEAEEREALPCEASA